MPVDTPPAWASWSASVIGAYASFTEAINPFNWLSGIPAAADTVSTAAADVLAAATGKVAEAAGKVTASAGKGLAAGLGLSGFVVVGVGLAAAYWYMQHGRAK